MRDRRAVLLDIDGVLTISWRPLPGAARAVSELREGGWPVAFVTNTTSTTRREISRRLGEAGIDVGVEEVFTAPRAAAAYLTKHHPGARCLLLTEGSIEEDLDGVELVARGADVVLTGGAGPAIGYEKTNAAYQELLSGAAFVAMHKNLCWETAQGSQLDMGAFVIGLEHATGVRATVVGKPSSEFFGSVLGWLGASAADALMVGDDIEADVLGAQRVGLRGVLVRTGKFRERDLQRADASPDEVIDSIADLRARLDATTPQGP